MHKIVFKELEFRNFMSYGNTRNLFEFRDGLTWLSGDNGFGKSAIVEAMTFALLGVSYRGGKKEELRNTKNAADGAPTVVQLTFDTENPQDGHESWRITRSITGKTSTIKFTIEKLVGDEWVAQNKRAGFSQQDFEEKVLQFNEVLFKNVIAMNTQETLPFFMLPAAKKRELLESIISLSLDAWKKANHKRLSEATISFNVAQSDSNQLTEEIAELRVIYQRLKDERAVNMEQMKADYDAAIAKSSELQTEIDNMLASKSELDSSLETIRTQLSEETVVDKRIAELRATARGVEQLDVVRDRYEAAKTDYDNVIAKTADAVEENRSAMGLLESLRTDLSELQQKHHTCERQISSKETTISLLVSNRDAITEQANSFIVGTPCPTCGHISDEADVERHKDALRKKWSAENKKVKLAKDELNELVASRDGLSADIEKFTKQIESYSADVDNFNQNVKPDIDRVTIELRSAESSFSKLKKLVSDFDIDKANAELDELNVKKSGFPVIREEFDRISEERTELIRKISDVRGQKNHEDSEAARLRAEIEKAEGASDDAISVMEGKIAKNESMLAEAVNRMHDASDTIAICNTITKVCADDGMKKMVFSMFVPAFNKAVQRNITKAHLPFVVTFDDSMSYTFQTLPGLSPSYTMLSQGQKRKLGFAISMAFRDFVSLVGNFNVNFLSLDEVLDISTDDNSMRDMLDLAKLMLEDIGCAVIITHRGKVVSDKFDFHQAVTNNGLYSMLGPIKPMWTKEDAGEN